MTTNSNSITPEEYIEYQRKELHQQVIYASDDSLTMRTAQLRVIRTHAARVGLSWQKVLNMKGIFVEPEWSEAIASLAGIDCLKTDYPTKQQLVQWIKEIQDPEPMMEIFAVDGSRGYDLVSYIDRLSYPATWTKQEKLEVLHWEAIRYLYREYNASPNDIHTAMQQCEGDLYLAYAQFLGPTQLRLIKKILESEKAKKTGDKRIYRKKALSEKNKIEETKEDGKDDAEEINNSDAEETNNSDVEEVNNSDDDKNSDAEENSDEDDVKNSTIKISGARTIKRKRGESNIIEAKKLKVTEQS